MAKVKEFYFEAAELAFKSENASPAKRPEALANWQTFLKDVETEIGNLGVIMAVDIYDQIADRAGDIWEDFIAGHTIDELKNVYAKELN